MIDISHRVALINGAGGGIGNAVATRFAAAGVAVGLVDSNPESLQTVSQLISRQTLPHMSASFDASELDAMEPFVDEMESQLGPISILVNCAGRFQICPVDELSFRDWEETLRSNLTTVFVACKIIAPRMRSRGTGSIVNFASTAGEYGSIRPAAHYAAAKGGVIAFSKSLAREVSPSGVRVNVISPGPVDTSMLQAETVEAKRAAAARTLLGRVGSPQEIAEAVYFLASDASSFITGHVLRVNGGALL